MSGIVADRLNLDLGDEGDVIDCIAEVFDLQGKVEHLAGDRLMIRSVEGRDFPFVTWCGLQVDGYGIEDRSVPPFRGPYKRDFERNLRRDVLREDNIDGSNTGGKRPERLDRIVKRESNFTRKVGFR